MIAECLQSASYWSVCCATSSSRDRGWKVYPNTLVRYARVARKSPQTAECVVVEGVFLEPVSTPALTGKRTGNFAESGLPMRFSSLIHERIQELAAKFPM